MLTNLIESYLNAWDPLSSFKLKNSLSEKIWNDQYKGIIICFSIIVFGLHRGKH